MTIRPTSSGQTPRPGIRDAGRTSAPGAPTRPGESSVPAAPGAQRDGVHISAEARQLQQQDGSERGGASELGAERMKSILDRISSGWYERPEVRDQVLNRLARDL